MGYDHVAPCPEIEVVSIEDMLMLGPSTCFGCVIQSLAGSSLQVQIPLSFACFTALTSLGWSRTPIWNTGSWVRASLWTLQEVLKTSAASPPFNFGRPPAPQLVCGWEVLWVALRCWNSSRRCGANCASGTDMDTGTQTTVDHWPRLGATGINQKRSV